MRAFQVRALQKVGHVAVRMSTSQLRRTKAASVKGLETQRIKGVQCRQAVMALCVNPGGFLQLSLANHTLVAQTAFTGHSLRPEF